MKKSYILFVIGLFVLPLLSCSDKEIEKPSALKMMETVFVESYSYGAIKTLLDDTMQLYSLPITEENYRKFGSVLVSLRKETGVSEK